MGRQLLMERTTQGSSSKVSVIRVDFPPGFKTPLHTHEGEGPRYVLKGRLRVEDHGQIQVYGAGDTFWENGSPMTIENIGGSDAQMLVVELAKSP
jgi:quercetin dioxygenase-like cupin family protein